MYFRLTWLCLYEFNWCKINIGNRMGKFRNSSSNRFVSFQFLRATCYVYLLISFVKQVLILYCVLLKIGSSIGNYRCNFYRTGSFCLKFCQKHRDSIWKMWEGKFFYCNFTNTFLKMMHFLLFWAVDFSLDNTKLV